MANQDNQPVNDDLIEKWLENYFLDPLTSFYDQTQFRIDLYETDTEWIVEALLNDFTSAEITVFVEKNKLLISGKSHVSSSMNQQMRTRSIEFPFPICNKKINAAFHNGILEVFISKIDKEYGKNRYITLP